MASDPLVSVVIPTYDRPNFLKRAVASVISQTYDSIELIVVDDASPAPAAETLETIETDTLASFRCLRHTENQGGSAARTTGIESADGKYIAFLDDDDEWNPTKVQKQVHRFEEFEDVVLVYTGIRQVNTDGVTNAVKTPTIEGNVVEQLLKGNFIGSYSAVMVDVNTIKSVGTPDERFPSWQDWEWYLRLAHEGLFLSVPEPLVIRHNEHEQMSSDFETKRDVSYPLLLEEGLLIAQEYGLTRTFKSGVTFELAIAAIRNERFREARRYLIRSLRFDSSSKSTWLYLILTLGGKFTFKPIQLIKRVVVRSKMS